jgi:hypothetical protein
LASNRAEGFGDFKIAFEFDRPRDAKKNDSWTFSVDRCPQTSGAFIVKICYEQNLPAAASWSLFAESFRLRECERFGRIDREDNNSDRTETSHLSSFHNA